MNRHATAVISATGVLTYRGLHQRAERYRSALAQAGLGAGDVLAIALPDSQDAVAALLAALRSGTPFTWLTADLPAERQDAIIADCAPRAVLTSPGTHYAGLPVVHVLGDDTDVVRQAPAPGTAEVPKNTEYLVYTSGSTGLPKGIAQRSGNLDQLTRWLGTAIRADERSLVLQWARLGYDAAYVEILTGLHAGAAVVVPPGDVKGDAARLHEWITHHGVTHVQTVPSLLRHLLNVDAGAAGSVRALSLFGESLRAGLVDEGRARFPNAVVHNFYGPTECILATWQRVPEPATDPISLGEAIPGRQILLTGDDGAEVGEGEVGEIRVRSVFLAHGYLNRPWETERAFRQGDVYRTGDLARRTPDGRLVFVGRSDDQLKIRGARVDLGEIEAALARDPAVAQAAVKVYGESQESLRPAAYVVARPEAVINTPALHRRLALALPTYMVPAAYVVLSEMPLTASGKIDRRRLPDPERDTRPVEFGTDTERALARIWCEVIGCEQAGPDDDFFAIGGYSLLVPQVTAEVLERLGADLPVRAVFDRPILRELAAHIDHAPAGREEES